MAQDLELAGAFKAALPYLAVTAGRFCASSTKSSPYICYALDKAHHFGEITPKARSRAQNLVMARLGNHFIFKDWLIEKIGWEKVNEDHHYNMGRKLQDARRRWLLSLTEEFS